MPRPRWGRPEFNRSGVAGIAAILTIVNAPVPPPDVLPPLDSLQRLLLPVADRFMLVMLSRPPTGTLRTTRVTAVSIGLGIVTFGVSGTIAALLVAVAGRLGLLLLVPALLLAGLAVGAASLALYGLRQRR